MSLTANPPSDPQVFTWKDRNEVPLDFTGQVSRTQQHFLDQTDINLIMKQWEKTGSIEHVNQHQGSYGDFTGAVDYATALTRVSDAQDAFDDLPSEIRKRMGNSPGVLLDFLSDPDNLEEAVELGLVAPPVIIGDPAPANPVPTDPMPENPTPVAGGD